MLAASSLAAVIIWLCFFSHLSALGLVGPDEPRYAAVAREMAATGDWVTPRLYGQPWFEKPTLYYWAAAACFRLFGGSELPARLPSALAALAAALAVARLAWKHYGAGTLHAALLIFPTCVGAIGFARAATPDMLFAAALTLALASAAGALRRAGALRSSPGTRPGSGGAAASVALFGAWLGVAALAKGPAALILAAGSIALWAAATRLWKHALLLARPLAILSFCVVALPWYALCALRNPGFLSTFLVLHNFRRYLTPVFQHRQPFWFFAPILLLGLLPWTALLLALAGKGMRLREENSWRFSPGLFLLCWIVFPAVFFSFSQSKLPGYVLPAIPPLAVLLASALQPESDSAASRWVLVAVGLTWMALAFSIPHWMKRFPAEARASIAGYNTGFLWAALAGGLVIVLLALFRRPLAAVAFSSMLLAALAEFSALRVLPRLDPYLSARVAARSVEFAAASRETVRAYGLQRPWQYGLSFYLSRELPEWAPATRAPGTPAAPGEDSSEARKPALVYTNATALEELVRSGRAVVVLDKVSPEALLVRVETAAANGAVEPSAAGSAGRN